MRRFIELNLLSLLKCFFFHTNYCISTLMMLSGQSPLVLVCHIASPTRRHTLSSAVHGGQNNQDTVLFPVDANNPGPNPVELLHGHKRCHPDCWRLKKKATRKYEC